MNFAKELGKSIKEKRIQLGLTQLQVAEKANIQNATLSKIENGKLNPSIQQIEKLSLILNLNITLS